MQTWLRTLPRLEKGSKPSRKNRRSRPAWRSNFDARDFGIERLEDRTLLAADIGIAQLTFPPLAAPIGPVTTTFLVTNNDTLNPTVGASFTDTFIGPAGTTAAVHDSAGDFAAVNPYTSATAISFTTQIPAGQTDTVTVTLTTTAAGTLTNSASVNETGDTNPFDNNTGVTTTVIAPAADAIVSIAKVGPPVGTVGNNLTYTVTTTNAPGAASAAGVVITDTLPTGVTFFSATDPNGVITHAGSTVTDTLNSNLAPGATDTLTIVATPGAATAGTTVTNSASVTTTTTNAGLPTTAMWPTFIAAATDAAVSIAKIGPAVGTVGNNLTYTVTTSNLPGAASAAGVVITDTLPTGVTFFSATDPNGVITHAGSTVTDTLNSNLAPGTTDTLTIVATPGAATAGTTVTNLASVTTTTTNVGVPTTADWPTVIATAAESAVSIAKIGPPAGTVGNNLTYTVTTTNLPGAVSAAGVVITDTLPAGVTFFSATDPNGVITHAGSTVTDTLNSNLAPGATDTLTIVATPGAATAGTTVTNSASVTTTTPNVGVTTDTATTVIATAAQAAVSIAKIGPPVGTVGNNLTYTVTTTNLPGAASAAGVVITDTLPAGVTFVSATDPNGVITHAGSTVTDTLNSNLAAGATDTLTIVATPGAATAGTTVINSASVTTTTPNVGVPTTATATTVIATAAQAAVSIAKIGPPVGTVGNNLTYTVTTSNLPGAASAAGVIITDTLPAGVTFVSATDPNGTITHAGSTVTDTLNSNLAAGATDTLTIVATPGAATAGTTVTNSASVTTTTPNVGVPTTATASTVIATAAQAAVSIAKIGPPVGTVGNNLTYTVTTSNLPGAASAAGVIITDTLPAGVTFVSATDPNGTITHAGSTVTDTLNSNLAAGATDTLTIVATPGAATAGTTVTNSASVTTTTPNVGVPTTATASTVIATAAQAAVSIAKIGPPVGTVGNNLTYTVTTSNLPGAASAAGVIITDTLPAGVTFVSATDPNGTITHAGSTVTDTLNSNLAAGATDTLTIVATPGAATAGTTVTNSASVTTTTPNVGVPTTATANTLIATAAQAVVSIAKTGPANGTVGNNLTYTVTTSNMPGAASAAGVVVTDTLPAGLTFVSATDPNGVITHAGSTVTDTLNSNLAGGATDTLTIVATPGAATGGTTVTNSASVTTTTSNIGTPSTATFKTAVAVPTPASLTITKLGPPNGTVGTPLTYTIIIANTGGTAATGASVTDTLPAGLTLVSATDATGTVTLSGNSFTDSLGSLAATTGTETIVVVATPTAALSGHTVTNTATLTFNSTTQQSSATTTIAGSVVVSHVCYLAGVPGDGTPQTFVTNLYHELLGREPDAPSMASFVSYLTQHNDSKGRDAVVSIFLDSPEYAIHYVSCVYEVFLGRAVDAGGLAFWTQKMGEVSNPSGHTGSADEKYILSAILGSTEFYNDAGGTPQGWINALYQDLLGRAPDGSGTAFWAHELATRGAGDRDGIVRDLLSTPEAVYDLLFGSIPGAGTAAHPLPANGMPAGQGGTELDELTGGGYVNLFFQGPDPGTIVDQLFNQLAGQYSWNTPLPNVSWDTVLTFALETDLYYVNPIRPVVAATTS